MLVQFPNEYAAAMAAAVDGGGNLHVFWADPDGTLIYTRRHAQTWTDPIDVLLSPDGSAASDPRVVVDAGGNVHIVWVGGRGYYASAPAFAADSARAWSSPVPLSAGSVIGIDIAAGPDGVLHVVYAEVGSNLFYVRSVDGGRTWSDGINVSTLNSSYEATHWPRLVVSDTGVIHVVWTNVKLPGGWPPLGVYYARSQDGGETWSAPKLMDEGGYDQIAVTTAPDGRVYLAWNGMAGSADSPSVGGRYFTWSADEGDTWGAQATITPGGFTSGNPEMAVDSAGTLHLISSVSGVDYTAWDGQRWSDLLNLTQPLAGNVGNTERPVLVSGEGNRLHVLFADSKGKIWYTTRQTAAPYVAPVPLAAPTAATPSPGPSPTVTVTPTVTTERGLPAIERGQPAPVVRSPMYPVVIGIAPVLLLLLVVILVRVSRARDHQA